MAISNRIFGSFIPKVIKNRLTALQRLAHKNIKPGDVIIDGEENENLVNLNNQDASGYLSSKTTIARLWTAVEVARDVPNPDKIYSSKKDLNAKPLEENEWVKPVDGTYEVHKWEYLPGSTKIYQIGNHTLNTLEKNPNTQMQTEGLEGFGAEGARALTPFEQETDFNKFMKPPAGITSISTETDGPLGVIKKATVKFVVHNFSDFERIYMRYFLRPGAHVFLDMGWDTAALYDPKTLIDESTDKLNEKLYGDAGYVQASKGDLDVLHGLVMNYDSSVREDGGFDCSVEIVSKNTSLVDSTINKNFKRRVEKGLQLEIQGLANSGRLGDNSFYEQSKKWGQSEQTREELKEVQDATTAKLFGGNTKSSIDLPGLGEDAENVLNEGVYHAGKTDKDIKLFVTYGFIEDKILNAELAFGKDHKSVTNAGNKNKSGNPEDNMDARFNSRNSFITYSKNLRKAMTVRAGYKDAFFLYPADWGSTHATYSTKRKMVPDDRINDIDDNGKYPSPLNIVKDDVDKNRIPIRELFISLDGFIDVVKASSTGAEILHGIADKINNSSFGITDVELNSNTYGNHTISLVDKNILKDADGNKLKTGSDERKDFLESLFVFKPFSPDTIVKDYSFEYNMPAGGMGSIIAIQSMGGAGRHLATDKLLEGILADEEINIYGNSKIPDAFVKWLPKSSNYAGQRLLDNITKGATKSFGLDVGDEVYTSTVKSNSATQQKNRINVGGVENQLESLAYAVDDTLDLAGAKVIPGTATDNSETIDEVESENATLVSSEYEFYALQARKKMTQRNNIPLPIQLSLTIYGTSGIMPGDLITVDYMPNQYVNNCFFQVLTVEHEIGSSWSTTLSTQMRSLPPVKPQNIADDEYPVKVETKLLEEQKKLPGIGKLFNYLDNGAEIIELEKLFGGENPVEVAPNISNLWSVHFTKTPEPDTLSKPWYMYTEIDKKEDYDEFAGFVSAFNKASTSEYGHPWRLWIKAEGRKILSFGQNYIYRFMIKPESFSETTPDTRSDKCNVNIVFNEHNNYIICPTKLDPKWFKTISKLFAVGGEHYSDGTDTTVTYDGAPE